MDLPSTQELNEFNRVLIAIADLTVQGQACSTGSVMRLCRSVAYGGRITHYPRILKLCAYAGFITNERGELKLTNSGYEFLRQNPDSLYEITDTQRQFVAIQIVLNGPWQSQARDLLSNFSPNYSKVTYDLNTFDNPPLVRHLSTIHLLCALGVLDEIDGVLRVKPEHVAVVRELRAERHATTQEELDQALQSERNLGAKAEEAVVEFERYRLRTLKRHVEAEIVVRISQLDVGAGYDIRSFDGEQASINHDRFIEVKASMGKELRFFWSINERRVAEQLGDRYWIYFVGGFRQEQKGLIIPIMIQDPARRLEHLPNLNIEISNYLITQQGPLPLRDIHQDYVGGLLL
jgi:hypothetical protein